MNRLFFWPDRRRYVLVTQPALAAMYPHAQRKFWQKEAGGEWFSPDPDTHGIIITAAKGPVPADQRARTSFQQDVDQAYQARLDQFALSRHAVGLWHTHPDPVPFPSALDLRTTRAYLETFGADRNVYLLAILGNRSHPPFLKVWAVSLDTQGVVELYEAAE